MKFLLILLFPVCLYSQNYIEVEVFNKVVDISFSTDKEYLNEVMPFDVVIKKEGREIKRLRVFNQSKVFEDYVTVKLETGTYEAVMLSVNNEIISEPEKFIIK